MSLVPGAGNSSPGDRVSSAAEQFDSDSASDAALVEAMASGNKAALASLYQRYASTLLALGQRITKDVGEAEDILHDVFLEAWRAARQFDAGRGTVRAWLVMRMRSRTLDRQRSARVTKSVSVDKPILEEVVDVGAEDPSLAPDRNAVRRALLELPEEQREIVLLSYFTGLSATEIATQLDIPTGTVKSRLAGARKKLRHVFSNSQGVLA